MQPPEGDGFYSSEQPGLAQEQEQAKADDESFSSKLERFWQFCRPDKQGNNTYLEVSQGFYNIKPPHHHGYSYPVGSVVNLVPVDFGLFLKFHYRISENPQNRADSGIWAGVLSGCTRVRRWFMAARILVIEDEEVCQFIEMELTHEGYEVAKAFDSRSGLELRSWGSLT